MGFWDVVWADLGAYNLANVAGRSRPKRWKAFLRAYLDTDFRVVFQTRLIQRLVRSRLKALGLLLFFRQKSRYFVDISPWAEIGPGLRLQHCFNIVIGPGVRIGAHCMLFNGVTLGNARPDILVNRMPTIGDYCILGTGAKIFGTIQVGPGLIIGANAVVKQDLLPGTGYFEELEREGRVRIRRAQVLQD